MQTDGKEEDDWTLKGLRTKSAFIKIQERQHQISNKQTIKQQISKKIVLTFHKNVKTTTAQPSLCVSVRVCLFQSFLVQIKLKKRTHEVPESEHGDKIFA